MSIRRYSHRGDSHCAKLLLMESCSEKAFAGSRGKLSVEQKKIATRPIKYVGRWESASHARSKKDEEKVDEESTE